jgi:hypothetical protein
MTFWAGFVAGVFSVLAVIAWAGILIHATRGTER